MKTVLAALAIFAEFVAVITIGSIYAESTGHGTIPALLWMILVVLAGWTWRSIRKSGNKNSDGEK